MSELKLAVDMVSSLPPLAITVLATWLVSQAIKQLPFDNRLMPAISAGVGAIFGLLVGLGWHGDLWQGLVFGLVAGILSVGSHTTVELLLSYLKK